MTAKHAAPRTTPRTVAPTSGPGRHAATDVEHLAARWPLALLVAVLLALAVACGIGAASAVGLDGTPSPAAPTVELHRLPLDLDTLPGNGAATADVESPADSCGDYCGTDAAPAPFAAGADATARHCLTTCPTA